MGSFLGLHRPKNLSSLNKIINMKINKVIAVPFTALALAASVFGGASAQVIGPQVALQFATNGLASPLVASSTDAVIARLLLDTTGSTEAVRIASLPFNLITANGASAGSLQNCRVFNESNLSVALNTPASTTTPMFTGINNIAFNTPLIVQPNTLTTLSLRCDVNGTLVSGGTYTVNMNTQNVVASGATTGIPALVTIRGGAVIPPIITPPIVIPGLPTTGASGETTQNLAMIAASLLIASLGFSYLNLKRKEN